MEKDYVWGGDTKWKSEKKYPLTMKEADILDDLREMLKKK